MQPGWGPYSGPNSGYPPSAAYGPPSGAPSDVQWGYPANNSTGPPAGGALPPYQTEGGINQGEKASPYPQYAAAGPQATVPPPLPMMQQPSPAPFQPSGRRRALIVGCNYRGASYQLGGCINDALCMRHLLKTRFGFRDEDFMMLTDDQAIPQRWPTRANMLYQMQMLVWDLRPGDSLFFSFSGHGSQVQDSTGDEVDGKSETICPCDFKQAGMIVDDELNRLLVNCLPPGVRMHVVIDACHSGSAMDLEFRSKFKPSRGPYWKQEYAWRPRVYKGTRGGECIQIGAARDKQTAADTNRLSGTVSTGAATFSFIQAIERNGTQISYGKLLESMYYSIASLHGGPPPSYSGFLGRMMDSAMDFAGGGGPLPPDAPAHKPLPIPDARSSKQFVQPLTAQGPGEAHVRLPQSRT